MPVRPTRSNPLSTRPVYLPKVPAKELQEAAKAAKTAQGDAVRIYIDGDARGLDVERLAGRLSEALGRQAVVMGDIVAALAGRPQTEVRRIVATAANAIAWARVRDVAKEDYRILPMRSEVDAEEARLRGRSQPSYGGVSHPGGEYEYPYDAAALQEAYRGLLGDEAAVVLTDRRLVTWSGSEWSATPRLTGSPLVLSVSDPSSVEAVFSSPGGVNYSEG
ncbi:MAG: hypothetical protein QME71_09625 [Dehalococcoidia bacterium]|nr:hypothetical protein [Dehalococcoidia bacterium]